ncbi:hypothetical protein G7062_03210 [Erysipelothrix sp. HDW6C]|uniref:hypothetical protein n=1 Tax=Erysipelothrix sp. HDW6C TaxID=2714930 RepID=UPI00140A24D6|nr:hypothetical protein [Erysipelothrix sp. HDW6C]QIK69363.1 hypothetical protein G7062_03210 [Erysipelothrix sp. HDW6C]
MKNNKKRTGVLAGLLAGALLITGTLAWQDVSQHKTNKFTTTSVEHNVTLVETFEEVSNWRKGEGKVNEIAVRNGQETDDVTQYIYEDAYVRLQLKEFMEIMNKSYIYSEKRYMVDEKGNFNRFETLELAQEFMVTLGEDAPEDGRIEEVTGFFDKDEEGNAKGFFYIATQQADKNGQYGKFVVMSEVMGEGDVLVEGSVNQNHSSDDQHNSAIVDEETGAIDYNVDEDQYTTHLWGAGDNMSAEGNPFTQYVKWTFGADVIKMADWNGQPTAKWIVDTDSTEGYVYWGEKLTHGTDTAITPKSLTTNLLEKVTLLEQPYGAAEYYIHVNMDAVNLKDVAKWDDAPEKIKLAYAGKDELSLAQKAMEAALEQLEKYDLESYPTQAGNELNALYQDAKEQLAGGTFTVEEYVALQKQLTEALEKYENDPVSTAKRDLNQELENAKKMDVSDKTTASAKAFNDALAVMQTLNDDINASAEDMKTAQDAMAEAIANLAIRYLPVVNGDRVENYAGHNWTVIYRDEKTGSAMMIVDELTSDDFKAMGIKADAEPNKMKITDTVTEIFPGYEKSKMKLVDDAFTKAFIENLDERAILPVKIPVENTENADWATRKEAPTIINKESGRKQAFSLSISDINTYGIQVSKLVENTSQTGFTRFRSNGIIGTNTETKEKYVRGSSVDMSKIELTGNAGINNPTQTVRPVIWVAGFDN